eukprot:5241964-Prymnesium_polylepis.2
MGARQVRLCGLTDGMETLLRAARSRPDTLAALQAATQHPGALNAVKDAVNNGYELASKNASDPQSAALLRQLWELGLLDAAPRGDQPWGDQPCVDCGDVGCCAACADAAVAAALRIPGA